MPTISAGLTTPANVVSGGTIQHTDVTTLYNALNALNIPDSVASLLQSAYSTGATSTVTGPSSSTSASALDVTVTVPANKVMFSLGTFSWAHSATASSTSFALEFRKNGTGFAQTQVISTSTAGNGLYFFIASPHDGTFSTPVIGWLNGGATSTGALHMFSSTSALGGAAWSSVGIRMLGTTSTSTSVHVLSLGPNRVWRET